MGRLAPLVERVVREFCLEFLDHPYLCRTEHALHALFFERLHRALGSDEQYVSFKGRRVCVVQKEYPTAADLDRSKRQNWDIAVLKTREPGADVSADSCPSDRSAFDFFDLDAVVEFGLNEGIGHLIDDLDRMNHRESAIDAEGRIAVHLLRLSDPLFSQRDWSQRSARIPTPDDIQREVERFGGVVFFCKWSDSGHAEGWRLSREGGVARMTAAL